MRVVFISNILTIHQEPFCENMFKLLGNGFKFIAYNKKLKETNESHKYASKEKDYFIQYEENDYITTLIDNSDLVIIGSAPDKLIINRLKKKRITFKYSERLYRTELEQSKKKIIYNFFSSYLHHGRFQKYPYYMLCASAYTVLDVNMYGNYKNRCYKWGYFPETKFYDDIYRMKKNNKIEIVWGGRMIELKHPELILGVAEYLAQKGYDFHINILGDGELRKNIEKQFSESSIIDKNQYKFIGKVDSIVMRQYMEGADIFLFTSDFREGWGAVLNEAMNSGCASIVSHAVGAAPYLIENHFNGLIFENMNSNDLIKKVEYLFENPKILRMLQKNAYYTIVDNWNAEIASKRIIELYKKISLNQDTPFINGICSKAELIKNDWIRGYQGE